MTQQINVVTKKTATVRDTIINNGLSISNTIVMTGDMKFEGQHLAHFRPAAQDEVHLFISAIINKSLVECCVPVYF